VASSLVSRVFSPRRPCWWTGRGFEMPPCQVPSSPGREVQRQAAVWGVVNGEASKAWASLGMSLCVAGMASAVCPWQLKLLAGCLEC